MPTDLRQFRVKLIDKILIHADSSPDIDRFIETAAKSLERNDVNGHVIFRFLEKTISELEDIRILNQEAVLQKNFIAAITKCRAMQEAMTRPVH